MKSLDRQGKIVDCSDPLLVKHLKDGLIYWCLLREHQVQVHFLGSIGNDEIFEIRYFENGVYHKADVYDYQLCEFGLTKAMKRELGK